MSIAASTGVQASAAGTPVAQSKGSEVDRLRLDADRRRVESQGQRKADAAAGATESEGQEKIIGQREGNGRQVWERGEYLSRPSDITDPTNKQPVRDPRHESGNAIDLCG